MCSRRRENWLRVDATFARSDGLSIATRAVIAIVV
jgi:hypothetical protein